MGLVHSQQHIETIEKLLQNPGKCRVHGYLVGNLIAETENSLNFRAYDSYNKNRAVVLKIVKSNAEVSDPESKLMQELRSPHLLELIDTFICHGFQCLVTPFAKSGTLLDHMDPADGITKNEAVVKKVMRQLLEAIQHLHSRNVVHRDVKLNNIYIMNDDLSSPVIVLADLGAAARLNGESAGDLVGTPVFIAPEVYEGKSYGTAVDLWSVGIVFFALLTGYSPFPSVADDVMKWVVLNREIVYPENVFGMFSAECRDLLQKMLTRDPSQRITASEALAHKWFATC